jgi:hypothetical protein
MQLDGEQYRRRMKMDQIYFDAEVLECFVVANAVGFVTAFAESKV